MSVQDDSAPAIYLNNGYVKIDGKTTKELHGLETAFLVKTAAGWRVQLEHSSLKH